MNRFAVFLLCDYSNRYPLYSGGSDSLVWVPSIFFFRGLRVLFSSISFVCTVFIWKSAV
ncbi:hypothetical protein BDQ94DRAFT_120834 [Aspergillus welwitschiae]|uniref:Uncharacterized protein n=1 Tax=Aspergillus welwitschiae TaxID=1341132 RepID=A0A3F3QAA4_9EURO|nr:hypothetical protein BDQ94DRAFT_120834 [Aspergillus welwitschiae]RDH36099.1 hypothetical protein BDQ94DRAFT_120834 [Aspergillus welwitschiae]